MLSPDIIDSLLRDAYNTILGIGIRFKEEDLRKWNRALTTVLIEAHRQSREIPRLHAVDYCHVVVGNIMEGRHGIYAPYHPRYEAWKAQYGRAGGGYWKLFGDLVQAIGNTRVSPVGKYEYAWFAGVPAGVKDRGGKSWFGRGDRGKAKEIAWYGRIMEEGGDFGTQSHPARPIFGPSLQDYLASGQHLQRAEAGFLKVAARWR